MKPGLVYARTVKINSAGTVGVDFSNYPVQIRAGKFIIEGGKYLLQRGRRYISVPFAIVQTERLFQFLLHRFGILLLQESASDFAESVEVYLTGPFRIVLRDQGVQIGIVEQLAHRVQYR